MREERKGGRKLPDGLLAAVTFSRGSSSSSSGRMGLNDMFSEIIEERERKKRRN